jgi:hypothetical protein
VSHFGSVNFLDLPPFLPLSHHPTFSREHELVVRVTLADVVVGMYVTVIGMYVL